jgi:predicted  nucleic acid-binding Zn-ribbon protein
MTREFDQDAASGHEEFRELCALANTDALDEDERARLAEHLAHCAECRELSEQYSLVAREGMPMLASEFAGSHTESNSELAFDLPGIKAVVLAQTAGSHSETPRRVSHFSHPAKRRLVPALGVGLAAAAVLIAVSVISYQRGRASVQPVVAQSSELTGKLQNVSTEKAALDSRLGAESQRESQLEQQSQQAQATVADLQSKIETLTTSAQGAAQANSALSQQVQSLSTDKSNLTAQLQQAQQDYQQVQTELTTLRNQRQQDSLHYASLEMEVTDLRHRLSDAQGRVNDDTQYLASDRDIRELMGARQLYIADVVDVDQNGDRRKPFGRVFYTKGKSLIFYAFDLDQQARLTDATYQAWAREGSDKAKPTSLGIFYVDSEANRRWALKASDPKVLSEINSVFVTVEPKGGSQKPTTKPLLYAYLRTETPNHP